MRANCGGPSGLLSGVPADIERQLRGPIREQLVRTTREAVAYDAMLEWDERLLRRARSERGLTRLPEGPGEAGIAIARAVAGGMGQGRAAACWSLFDGYM